MNIGNGVLQYISSRNFFHRNVYDIKLLSIKLQILNIKLLKYSPSNGVILDNSVPSANCKTVCTHQEKINSFDYYLS